MSNQERKTMFTWKRLLVVAALGLAATGVGLSANAGANQQDPNHLGPKAAVKSRDITDPNETTVSAVWRNGKFHFIQTHVKRKETTDEQGHTGTLIEEGPNTIAEAQGQLPPIDPAFDEVRPSPEQIANADATVNAWSPEGPMGEPLPKSPGDTTPGYVVPRITYTPAQLKELRSKHPLTPR